MDWTVSWILAAHSLESSLINSTSTLTSIPERLCINSTISTRRTPSSPLSDTSPTTRKDLPLLAITTSNNVLWTPHHTSSRHSTSPEKSSHKKLNRIRFYRVSTRYRSPLKRRSDMEPTNSNHLSKTVVNLWSTRRHMISTRTSSTSLKTPAWKWRNTNGHQSRWASSKPILSQ